MHMQEMLGGFYMQIYGIHLIGIAENRSYAPGTCWKNEIRRINAGQSYCETHESLFHSHSGGK
jgi:hypothetical protein